MSQTKHAFVFPGQGSQSVGMLADLAEQHSLVQATFDEASAALGLDLWTLAQQGPKAVLDQTENTQPAMLAAGVAVWRCWCDQDGPVPALMAGHSLGEYTALVCAGAMTFPDAVRLVAERGRLMQAAVPAGQGAMAAILGLDDATVAEVCGHEARGQVLEPVNFNAPGQVVVAGDTEAVERCAAAAKAAGARRAVLLPVSAPSHCALMRSASEQLAGRLAEIEIQTPQIPVLHNVSVSPATDPEAIRKRLASQLHKPVRWVETIQAFSAAGLTQVVEAGPGKVLTGLGKRIEKGMTYLAVADAAGLEQALSEVKDVAG